MKKLLYRSCCLLLGLLAGCEKGDFLDQTSVSDLTKKYVFNDSARTMDFLAVIYSDIGFSFRPNRFGTGGLDAASDEAEGKSLSRGTEYVKFITGSLSAANVSAASWEIPYRNIRRVNLFLQHIDGAPFNATQRNYAKAEARFLRAWYYSIQIGRASCRERVCQYV